MQTRFADGDGVIVFRDFFLDPSVKKFVLQEQDRVVYRGWRI